jgi:arginine-tRNA-protein transferase
MWTERIEPERLTPGELDARLARGWYRMGDGLITTDFLLWDGEIRSTLWTRLDVRGHRFNRSVRKLMAGNGRRFRSRVGALVVDGERDRLYARYLEAVGGDRAESLSVVVGGSRGLGLFDSREVSVWDEERLVAFSWFDLGDESVESLIGVYDPEYARHSLGLYTMLLEIVETAALGKRYHYSGYVLAEPSSMDYKLRVGSLEYLDAETSRWLPAPPFPRGESPAEVLRHRLAAAAVALQHAGVEVVRYLNPSLRIPGLLEQVPQCPTQPLLLVCGETGDRRVLVAWERPRAAFSLARARAVLARLTRPSAPPEDIVLFLVEAQLGERSSAEEVAVACAIELASLDAG